MNRYDRVSYCTSGSWTMTRPLACLTIALLLEVGGRPDDLLRTEISNRFG